MSTKLTRAAYEALIAEDLGWLAKQPRTLERDHIEALVRDSVRHHYPDLPPAEPAAPELPPTEHPAQPVRTRAQNLAPDRIATCQQFLAVAYQGIDRVAAELAAAGHHRRADQLMQALRLVSGVASDLSIEEFTTRTLGKRPPR